MVRSNDSKMRLNVFCRVCLFLAFGAGLFVGSPIFALEDRPDASAQQPSSIDVEEYVRSCFDTGKTANLAEKFGQSQRIKAEFLEELLIEHSRRGDFAPFVIRMESAIIEGELDLSYAEIPYTLSLNNCDFEGKLILAGSKFNKDISLNGTTFHKDALFNDMTVSGNCFFNGSQFMAKASFNGMNIGSSAFFRTDATGEAASFEGRVDFGYASFGRNLEFADASFYSATEPDFRGIRVVHSVILDGATFLGAVTFCAANIQGDLRAIGTDFRGRADFQAMVVGKVTFFDKAQFDEGVDFAFAEIKEHLYGRGVTFSESKVPSTPIADFRSMVIGGDVDLRSVFKEDDGEKVVLFPTRFEVPLKMTATTIKRDFLTDDMHLLTFDADSLNVGGTATFEKVTVRELLNLELSHFHSLKIDSSFEAQHNNVGKFVLSGMTFDNIKFISTTGDQGLEEDGHGFMWKWLKGWPLWKWLFGLKSADEEEVDRILKWISASSFDTQVYIELEKLYIRQGSQGLADKVYITMRSRQQSMLWDEGNKLKYAWSFFVGWAVNYGRSPHWAMGYVFVCWLVGLFLFPKDAMERSDELTSRDLHHPHALPPPPATESANCSRASANSSDDDAPPEAKGPSGYSRFWYVWDLMLPYISLQDAETCRPKEQHTVRLWAVRILKLLGWLLATVCLIALSGIF